MSEVNPVLDEFFPILIENFIRFETASLYVRSREAGAEVRRRQSLKSRRNIIIGSSITKLPRRSSA